MNFVVCPGCGLSLPKQQFTSDPPMNTSNECWHTYSDLAAYTISLQDQDFLHQTAVDCYEAQHGGGKTKPITVTFGLIGLYLVLEKQYTGKDVQIAHMQLANKNKVWPQFIPPTHQWEITVQDVLHADSGDERNSKIHDWAVCIWKEWEKDQQKVRDLTQQYLFSDL